MISFSEALALTLKAAVPLGKETVPLASALNRVLFQDIRSDTTLPPFDKSAVDGFACRRRDVGSPLIVIGEIAAGRMPTTPVSSGQCVRIMTGAPMPEGADCVVMVEHTQTEADGRVRFIGASTADNFCVQGEDLRAGDIVLTRGTLIGPAHLAVLAAVGCTDVPSALLPKVGVLATGDEIVPPEQVPEAAQIRNSNTPQLLAQLAQMGVVATDLGIVRDTEKETRTALSAAMQTHDVIVLTGGVSMGAYDHVPAVLKQLGFSLLYERVAMQPGKPTVFGRHDHGTYCFALPGNPVSSFVVFELVLKPFLYKLMGRDFSPRTVKAVLETGFRRKKTERQSTLPVRFSDANTVSLIEYHGSAHIRAMCLADGLLTIEPGRSEIKEGSIVDVRCL